jgi:drug/metabolite transporter (DMT)-like permease
MAWQPLNPVVAGYLCALGSTLFWSGNFIIARELNDSVPPVALAFWRWFVALLVLLPFAIGPLVREWATVRENLGYLAITAFLGVTLYNTLLYFGGQTTPALNLSLISITTPVFIVIFARLFYGEPLTLNKLLGILLVAVGVLLLITRGRFSSLLGLEFTIGDLWMLGGAMLFAIYSILVIRIPGKLGLWSFQLCTFALGFVLLIPFYAWERAVVGPAVVDGRAIASFLYLGIFASFISYLLWNRSILLIGASKAGMVYYMVPIFSGVLAWYFLGEQIGLLHVFSGLLIITGILTANRTRKKTAA